MQPPALAGSTESSPTDKAFAEIRSTNWLRSDNIISVPPDPPRLQRRRPPTGVLIFLGQPTLVSLTVCTERRGRWLADPVVERDLVESWHLADAWTVGRYVLMPDHLHLFCAPVDERFTIENWINYWKRSFKKLRGIENHRFQSGGFHHRLRRKESYDERWNYVRDNPVRAGLVNRAEDWSFAGELNELRW